jgi:hypothetical protein
MRRDFTREYRSRIQNLKTHFLRTAKSGLYFPSARSFLIKTSSMAEIIKHKLEETIYKQTPTKEKYVVNFN